MSYMASTYHTDDKDKQLSWLYACAYMQGTYTAYVPRSRTAFWSRGSGDENGDLVWMSGEKKMLTCCRFTKSSSSITGVVSRKFWVSKKSPLLAVGAISWKPKTSAKPLQLYYLVIRLVIRQSCTHTPVIRVRTPPSCRSIYRCLELHKLRATPESLPNWRNVFLVHLPEPWMWHPFHLVILTGTTCQTWCKTRSLRWYISNC